MGLKIFFASILAMKKHIKSKNSISHTKSKARFKIRLVRLFWAVAILMI